MRTVEILQYTLKRGTGKDFHKIMVEQSAPLHRASGMDIVSFGNSIHDEDSYYLIRSYADLGHLKSSQDAFYSSDAWINGPRTAIIDRIETSVKSVLLLGDEVIDKLRT
ncbi:MAG TPA: NIPSNAP family protein [Buttiauxella sp.]|nr:NIPSNAP family protein [Buttiauxella sp.]